MEDKKFAVLIDAENISAKYIKDVLREATKYGVVTCKRIYSDWTTNQTGKWKSVLMKYALSPVQQFQNTAGKNSTDSAMIIDAMDILYDGNVDGFCIVSSDSDFTRLATRLREAGKDVIGMGESKTPRSFRAACTVFTNLQVLSEQEEEDNEKEETTVEIIRDDDEESLASRETIQQEIAAMIAENDDKSKVTDLAQIGNRLLKRYPDFDVRTYGYRSLSKFVGEMDRFEMVEDKGALSVRLKRPAVDEKSLIDELVIETVRSAGEGGMEIGQLRLTVNNAFKDFKVKNYGYSTFINFVRSVPGVQVMAGRGSGRLVRMSE